MGQDISIKVLNSKFEVSGEITPKISFDAKDINQAVVHQIVKATLAGRRQGNACTKVRSKVRGGGAKPFKQKGTGRARQGSNRSPLLVGGGTTFGPQTRSFRQKINKKMALKGIHSILVDKFQAGKLLVLETLESSGKTKEMHTLLNSRGLMPALVVTEKKDSLALRAVRNLEFAKGMAEEGLSVYEAVKFENLIIEKKALENIFSRLEGK